jgi:hypothetical protein
MKTIDDGTPAWVIVLQDDDFIVRARLWPSGLREIGICPAGGHWHSYRFERVGLATEFLTALGSTWRLS